MPLKFTQSSLAAQSTTSSSVSPSQSLSVQSHVS
jgi:hypothetical protein